MTKRNIILIGLFIIGLTACREAYWPELTRYEGLLVVDGTITDKPGPYEIKLSVSADAQDPEYTAYAGAQITLLDNIGNEEILTEVEPGTHRTAEDGIQGVIGNKYKIIIRTPDERTYESAYQELVQPLGLDTVYGVIENRPTDDPAFYLWGIQFYLSTELATSDTNYYLWRTHATYEYHSDFLIRFYYDGGIHPFTNSDSLYYCWKEDLVNMNLTASTHNLSEPVIRNLPLHFVDTETRKLSVKYSLLVQQYTLNEPAFDFFNQLQGVSGDQGNLYSTQPYQIKGNVKNIRDPEEPVLGYFLAAGVTERRIFVDRPSGDFNFHYGVCQLTRADYEAYGYIGWTDPVSWPLYVTTNPDGVRALPPQGCLDCTANGGTTVKPDFWID
jgi:hypothetical protein